MRLVPDEILVLRVALDLPAGEVAALRPLLPAVEVARADRFRREVDRDRFVVRRGRLRIVLAYLLDVAVSEVVLGVGPRGKPVLADPRSGLCFNLSHSAGWALLAFTLGTEIGVDLECARRAPDARALAERFFTRREAAYLAACPHEEVERAFFSLWTRKEAVVKCVGEGLHLDLDAFELAPASVPTGERVQLEAAPGGALWVRPLPPPTPGAVGAVASVAPRGRLRCLGFEGAGG